MRNALVCEPDAPAIERDLALSMTTEEVVISARQRNTSSMRSYRKGSPSKFDGERDILR